MILLCSSFNIHERIIQDVASLCSTAEDGPKGIQHVGCVLISSPPETHTHTNAVKETVRGNACYTLMTSPSWLASWAIFHRLSSVAVERPPPIPSPSSLMYTTLTQWMISDIASLGWSKDNIMWPLITPLTTPPPSEFPHKPPFSFRIAWCRVFTAICRILCEQKTERASREPDIWHPIIAGHLC